MTCDNTPSLPHLRGKHDQPLELEVKIGIKVFLCEKRDGEECDN
jgi:hypothetical protein